MNRRHIMIVSGPSLMAASLWLIAGSLPRSAAAEIPEPLRNALESNAKALSPITLSWERTRTSDFPRPKAQSMLRETSVLFEPTKSRFLWDNGKFYSYGQSFSPQGKMGPKGPVIDPDAPLLKLEAEIAFDGEVRYCSSTSGGPPIVVVDPLSNMVVHDRQIVFVDAGFLTQLGFRIPDRVPDYEAKQSAKSYPLYLIEKGARVVEVGREQIDGMDFTALVLRFEDRDIRFALDSAKGYAVRRRSEWPQPGTLAVQADCLEFTQLPGSALWMPGRIEVQWHTWPGVLARPVKEAVVRETFNITELSNKPIRPEQFVLKYDKAGSYVGDGTLAGTKDQFGRVMYRVPADPNDLDEVIKAATSDDFQPKAMPLFSRLLILGHVLGILVVAIVASRCFGRKSS
jgi:hypothetical protein